jgi:Zn-dependent alcohol dehydrogenase
VIGCGGVGLAVVQGARSRAPERIVAVDVAPEKLELARELGATDAVLADNAIRRRARADRRRRLRVLAITPLRRGSCDACGCAPTRARRRSSACRRPADARLDLERTLRPRSVTLAVTHGGDTIPQRTSRSSRRRRSTGKLDLARFVTSTISLDEVPDRARAAHRRARRDPHGRAPL